MDEEQIAFMRAQAAAAAYQRRIQRKLNEAIAKQTCVERNPMHWPFILASVIAVVFVLYACAADAGVIGLP